MTFRGPLYQSKHLRAKGNLSYLDFLRLLGRMWLDAHPDIPFVAQTGKEFPVYPVIGYRQDLTKPHPVEPKPRYREEIATATGEPAIIIAAQRFQMVITFTIYTQENPQLAEEILEVFELFILEMTPVFKELGASELVYARRLPDTSDQRPNISVVERSVSYMLTIEKSTVTTVAKLEQVLIDARVFMEEAEWLHPATPDLVPTVSIVDTFSATPNRLPPLTFIHDVEGVYEVEDDK